MQEVSFVAYFPEFDVKRQFKCDPNMTAMVRGGKGSKTRRKKKEEQQKKRKTKNKKSSPTFLFLGRLRLCCFENGVSSQKRAVCAVLRRASRPDVAVFCGARDAARVGPVLVGIHSGVSSVGPRRVFRAGPAGKSASLVCPRASVSHCGPIGAVCFAALSRPVGGCSVGSSADTARARVLCSGRQRTQTVAHGPVVASAKCGICVAAAARFAAGQDHHARGHNWCRPIGMACEKEHQT